MTQVFVNSYSKLDDWVKRNSYRGYDAYDGLNSELVKNIAKGPYSRLLFMRLSVNFPLNFRPLLGVRPGSGSKALSLISSSYLRMFNSTKNIEYLLRARKLLKVIKRRTLKNKYGEHCWSSHYFDLQIGDTYLSSDTPCMVGTAYPSFALFDEKFYFKNKSRRAVEILESSARYLINHHITECNDLTYFKYRSFTPRGHITHGVNAIGAGFFARLFYLTKNLDYLRISKNCLNTTIKYQRSNGSWPYSQKIDGEIINEQVDFHQGLILDSIIDFINFTNPNEKKYVDSLIKGAKFYKNEQFLSDGRCKWRWPKTWPIDTHNQAQGIITFSKLSKFDSEFLSFAKIIAQWTIQNMQDKSGYFYHQQWPFFTNKIPYIRWSQAWMMFALSILLEHINENE